MKYWAHSDPEKRAETDTEALWQPLRQHLQNVGILAESFAKEASPEDIAFQKMARATGLLHDVGKYSDEFQQMIRGLAPRRAPHSAHGAAVSWQKAKAAEAAFAIAGHHGGIPDAADLRSRTDSLKEIVDGLWAKAILDCPGLIKCLEGSPALLAATAKDITPFDVRTRMLFSCLIDADRMDTARHYRPHDITPPAASLSAAIRLERLVAFAAKKAAGVAEGSVKEARRGVLDACRLAAGRPGNIFSLTVPTGGAKTLASMAFALERAVKFPGMVRRIIVVIPYLSIIEQNAQVFIDALGEDAVLEHHSGDFERLRKKFVGEGSVFVPIENDEDEFYRNPSKRRSTENWDAPVIVTTSVRFFDSLFSNRPSDLRRMHNLARSVVILDEVQTLPRHLVAPILRLIEELSVRWNTTFLFCTATQPAFEKPAGSRSRDPRWAPGKIQEIIPDPGELFRGLKRVEVSWPKNKRSTWTEVAHGMLRQGRALCIVNIKGACRGALS